MTLRVWVNDRPVGRIERMGKGMSFAYDAGVEPSLALSLSMPVRVASYDQKFGLLPIFDTNLPEGYLKDAIRKYLAKERGQVSDYDILETVGGNMIGRVRVLPDGQAPERRQNITDLDAILQRKATSELVSEVIARYGLRSGVSGAMPKSLVSDEDAQRRKTVQTRDYILKFDAPEYPGLSLNEFWCLEAARAAGCRTVEAQLGRNGDMLSVRRFDAREDGERLAFEDAASLNGLRSEEKYGASMEKALFRTLQANFGTGPAARAEMAELYRQAITSIALRNGDAHLKNFGVLYQDAERGPVRLTAAYDLVTTTVYIRNDLMSMTLNGTTRWPKPEALELLGARAGLSRGEARTIMAEVAAGLQATLPAMVAAFDAAGHGELGRAIAGQWNDGLAASLKAEPIPVAEPDPFSMGPDETPAVEMETPRL